MVKRVTDRELVRLFANKKIAPMQELKHALGTEVDMTVYRALKRLSYRTSYSHGGRYYALSRMVEFDEKGLWSTKARADGPVVSLLLEQCLRAQTPACSP